MTIARARLVPLADPTTGREARFAAEATIGRSSSNSVVLELPGVSRRHARIWFDDERGGYWLEDLGSRNGTRLDGLPVERPEPLGRLHVIEFGGSGDFLFVRGEAPTPGEAPAAGEETTVERLAPDLPAGLAERIEDLDEAGGADSTTVERRAEPLPSSLAERTRPETPADGEPGDGEPGSPTEPDER